MDNYIYHMHIL